MILNGTNENGGGFGIAVKEMLDGDVVTNVYDHCPDGMKVWIWNKFPIESINNDVTGFVVASNALNAAKTIKKFIQPSNDDGTPCHILINMLYKNESDMALSDPDDWVYIHDWSIPDDELEDSFIRTPEEVPIEQI